MSINTYKLLNGYNSFKPVTNVMGAEQNCFKHQESCEGRHNQQNCSLKLSHETHLEDVYFGGMGGGGGENLAMKMTWGLVFFSESKLILQCFLGVL